jgi:hypothetical protein
VSDPLNPNCYLHVQNVHVHVPVYYQIESIK